MKKFLFAATLCLLWAAQSFAASSPPYVARSCSLASAATTDIGASCPSTAAATVTGTTNISSLGATASVGSVYDLVFSNSLTLYQSSSLLLPGGSNLVTAAGMGLHCSVPATAGNWICNSIGSPGVLAYNNERFNVNAATLKYWRAAIANAKSGVSRSLLLFLGDSTTVGAGAGTSGTQNLVGAFANNYPNQFVALLKSAGIPVSFCSFFDDQNVTPQSGITYPLYDPRVTLGANWGFGAGSLAGALFQYNTGAVNNLTFAPGSGCQFDHFTIWYVQFGGKGSFTLNIDGGSSLGTINAAGTSSLLAQTFTVTKGTHTINLVPNNDGGFNIVGMMAWDSTTTAIDVIQAGDFGGGVGNFNATTNPWSPLNVIGPNSFVSSTSLSPTFTVSNLTINDSNNQIGVSTYTSEYQSQITAAQTVGGVLLAVGPPSNSTQATNGTLDQYIAAQAGLALSNGAAQYNLKQRWTSYAVTNALLPYFSGLHPAKPGYSDEALGLCEILCSP